MREESLSGGGVKSIMTVLDKGNQLHCFQSGNPPALSSSNPTLPLQSSIPISRHPYPTNLIPYGHYYLPVYVSPHQFLSHNGFPQQPSAGNTYFPTVATPSGLKFPFQLKPGANGAPFISPPVGYAPSPMSPGSSSGQLACIMSENSVWVTAPGQDISSLQVNSMYTLPLQGQHLSFHSAQAGQGFYAGVYQPGQTIASMSTFLQHAQAMAGSVENVGPPSGAYLQAQHAQINNQNANF
ncbi:GBF-interacting protein 1, putative isoform 1 [Quillaja saponaria]|uniref:GBF-interacting protein 1, putative isoform 1 n=1 Tax=Quillaja saponaria TaxID=32244 RepID=A0AAD7LMP9_QUISA|nr:GBF-interacting protein 1, putative isoform 1 [Quillaja saponaria]